MACAGLAGIFPRCGLAQAPLTELPGAVTPGRDRSLPQPPDQPSFDFTIEAPNRSQVPRSIEDLRFLLRDISIEGAHKLSAEGFHSLYADLIGKQVSVGQILDIAEAMESQYHRAGYVLAHAYVPPQRVDNGVFKIEVIEGYVDAIAVEGGDAATQALVRTYLQPVLSSRPLELAVVERALLLANDLPGISAAGLLRSSPDVTGASDLAVTLAQSDLQGGLSVNNRDSEFYDRWMFTGDAEMNSLALAGDQLALTASTARNALEKLVGQARYRAPIGSDGATASMIGTVTHSEPSGSLLAGSDLVTDSYAVGPRLAYPVMRSRALSVSIDGGLTMQDARSRQPGHLISHDQWRVADVSATYSGTSVLGGVSASLDAAQGLGILGATSTGTLNGDGQPVLSHSGNTTGNPEFTKLTATARYTRELVAPVNFVVTAQAQYAFAPLLAGEQIAFGGSQIGRGYDPSAITGDHGAGGAFELDYDLRVDTWGLEALQPYIFFDTAKVWDRAGGAPALSVTAIGVVGTGSGLAIASTGLGVRFSIVHNISGGIELAHTLKAVPGSDNGQRATKILFDAAVRF